MRARELVTQRARQSCDRFAMGRPSADERIRHRYGAGTADLEPAEFVRI